jgi:hypothetical protein
VQFAIEADSEAEALTILRQVLEKMSPDLPLRGEPVIRPRHRRHPDNIWIAELTPDVDRLEYIDPDNAKTRCRWVQGHFPVGVYWHFPQNTEREAKAEWPLDIWQRQPGRDDMLLYPQVRAARIHCLQDNP